MTTRNAARALPTRILGRLEVPAVGLGAMVLSPGMYGEVDEDGAMRAIAAALDVGCTFLDTSDGYGPDGHNERLVGRAVRGRRDEVVVATKFGFRVPAGTERHRFPVGFAFGDLAVNCHPSLVRGYAEQSLRELGSDRIDPHFPDPQVPLTDTVGAVAELIAAGWCATSACRTSPRRSCGRRTRSTRSRRCRPSGRCGARSTRTYWQRPVSSGWGWSPGPRSARGSSPAP